MEDTLHHGRPAPVATVLVNVAARHKQQAAGHTAVGGHAHRPYAVVVATDDYPDIRGGGHRCGKLHKLPVIFSAGAHGVGSRGCGCLVVAAGVHGDVVHSGVYGVEHHRGHLLGGVKCRRGQLHATGVRRVAGDAAVAVAHGVASADRDTRGGEAVAAAVGVNLARIAGGAVGPAVEAVAFGQGGRQDHRVAEGEAAGGASISAVVHRHRRAGRRACLHRGRDSSGPRGAPRGIGANAY